MRILFVCLGNICRSPTAEGVMQHLARQAKLDVVLDSAGTGAWHVGEPPDPRTVRAAKQRGYDLSQLRARQLAMSDFSDFDLILAMDQSNLANIRRMSAQHDGPLPEIRLLRSFDPIADDDEVPDPYSGGERGFVDVIEMCERACAGIVQHVRNR